MTRRPNRLSDADIGRLLAHMPDPPPASADLTDRIVAKAVGENAAARRRAPRHFGRRIWWAIAILGAAGAVTAAAASAGRFEFTRVLEWPQEIARVAGWAPLHHRGPLFVRAERRPTPRLGAGAFAPTPAGPRALTPLAAERGEGARLIATPPAQRVVGAHQIERPLRLLVRPQREARFAREHRRAPGPGGARIGHAEDHAAMAAPPARPTPAFAPRNDIDRAAKDDVLRFHDADAYARRQRAGDRDWRARNDLARRAWAASAQDRPWAAGPRDRRWAANGDHRWARPSGWRRQAGPFHPFRPHPPRGRRRW